MTEVLNRFHFRGVVIYMDGRLIYYGNEINEHVKYVNDVLRTLASADARLKLRKIEIGRKQVDFLGMRVSEGDGRFSKDSLRVLKQPKDPKL